MDKEDIYNQIVKYPQTQKSLYLKLSNKKSSKNTEMRKLRKKLKMLLKSGKIQKRFFRVDRKFQSVYIASHLPYSLIAYKGDKEYLLCFKERPLVNFNSFLIDDAYILISNNWKHCAGLCLDENKVRNFC